MLLIWPCPSRGAGVAQDVENVALDATFNGEIETHRGSGELYYHLSPTWVISKDDILALATRHASSMKLVRRLGPNLA